tara:strand:+ start:314 stop:730 length:417 start_codon:yes stop_codon:yes gene_type:complete
MGNRAVIDMDGRTGIYLQWNGDFESVSAFIKVARDYGLRTDDYGIARLTQIIGNFFSGEILSLGVGDLDRFENMEDKVDEVAQRYYLGTDKSDRNQFTWEIKNVADFIEKDWEPTDRYNGIVKELHRINDPILLKEGA